MRSSSPQPGTNARPAHPPSSGWHSESQSRQLPPGESTRLSGAEQEAQQPPGIVPRPGAASTLRIANELAVCCSVGFGVCDPLQLTLNLVDRPVTPADVAGAAEAD